jgi:hypothetical protein
MKTILATLTAILLFTFSIKVNAQTNVVGGIYANTTWTTLGSPYIIGDSVVLFPGNTLTIQPGVTVKFKAGESLEIRQATIVAIGNATDSITFTADTSLQSPGFYRGLYLNQETSASFNYCNFRYGSYSLNATSITDTVILKNSVFDFNDTAIFYYEGIVDSCIFSNNTNYGCLYCYGPIMNFCVLSNNGQGNYYNVQGNIMGGIVSNCLIECNNTGITIYEGGVISNCLINHNITGIAQYNTSNGCTITNCIIDSNILGIAAYSNDTVINCEIKYNRVGLEPVGYGSVYTLNTIEDNDTGIFISNGPDTLYCNSICNNSNYNLYYDLNINSHYFHNNYWCSTDSATIKATIYDGFNNSNLGLAYFEPFDSVACNNVGPTPFPVPTYVSICNNNTAVPLIQKKENIITIYPNPFTTTTTLTLQGTYHNPSLFIYNLLGQEVRSTLIGTNTQLTINREHLASGMYFYKLIDENKEVIGIGKMVVE